MQRYQFLNNKKNILKINLPTFSPGSYHLNILSFVYLWTKDKAFDYICLGPNANIVDLLRRPDVPLTDVMQMRKSPWFSTLLLQTMLNPMVQQNMHQITLLATNIKRFGSKYSLCLKFCTQDNNLGKEWIVFYLLGHFCTLKGYK